MRTVPRKYIHTTILRISLGTRWSEESELSWKSTRRRTRVTDGNGARKPATEIWLLVLVITLGGITAYNLPADNLTLLTITHTYGWGSCTKIWSTHFPKERRSIWAATRYNACFSFINIDFLLKSILKFKILHAMIYHLSFIICMHTIAIQSYFLCIDYFKNKL